MEKNYSRCDVNDVLKGESDKKGIEGKFYKPKIPFLSDSPFRIESNTW